MNENLTDITIVLDRSGSMASVRSDTMGSFNTFLEDQKKVEGAANISLVQFDDQYEPNYTSVNIQEAEKLNEETYVPRGMTALHDAIGMTVNNAGRRLESLDASARPGRVIFVILTDGFENSSKEYSKEKVFEMIKHQKEKYNWQFLFLGANQDAIQAGAGYGISQGQSMTYAASGAGVTNTFKSLSRNISSSRKMDYVDYNSTGVENFSDEDRDSAMDTDE